MLALKAITVEWFQKALLPPSRLHCVVFYTLESFCELLRFGKQWFKLDGIPKQRGKRWHFRLIHISVDMNTLAARPLFPTFISFSSSCLRVISLSSLDFTSSQHVSPHLRSGTLPLLAFALIFSLPLSCSLCLSIYFTQSYLSPTLSALPPALLSFIFHSWVHSPPNLRPHLLSHPIDG